MMNPVATNLSAPLNRSVYLLPCPSGSGLTDDSERKAKFFGKFLGCLVREANESNQFFGQYCPGVSLSESMTHLRDAIFGIFHRSSKPEMARINACAHIAQMKNDFAQWHRSICQDPCDSMSPRRDPGTDLAVTSVVGEAKPQPAFVWRALGYLAPESFWAKLWFSHKHLHACDRGRLGFAPLSVPLMLLQVSA